MGWSRAWARSRASGSRRRRHHEAKMAWSSARMAMSVVTLLVRMFALMLVRVHVHVQLIAACLARRDQLDGAVLDAAGREDPVRVGAELLRRSLQDRHLETMIAIEVHMHR